MPMRPPKGTAVWVREAEGRATWTADGKAKVAIAVPGPEARRR